MQVSYEIEGLKNVQSKIKNHGDQRVILTLNHALNDFKCNI